MARSLRQQLRARVLPRAYTLLCLQPSCTLTTHRRLSQKSFLSLQNLQQIEELRQQFFSFLVDAGFVNITNAERRDLTSTRYGKSRTKFLRVPAELDTASRDPRTVMACLAASMYPKLLVIDPQNGSLRTLANSAPAAIHPSSVNFGAGRRVDFGQGTRFAAFFQAMHTKKLCTCSLSPIACAVR